MSVNSKPSEPRHGTAVRASYQPRDRIELQPRLPFNPYAGIGQKLYPQAFPASAGWTKPRGGWREYGILLALWLLVLLVAGVIGMRVLDLTTEAGHEDYSRASAALGASSTASAAARMADDDPFDDPLPILPPVRTPMPDIAATPSTPAATTLRASTDLPAARAQPPAAGTGAFAAAPEALQRLPAAPADVPATKFARMPAACAPALWAMQLCGEPGR